MRICEYVKHPLCFSLTAKDLGFLNFIFQGIPRSPTLYISGVAISCTPEQNASAELPSTDKEVAPEQALKTVRSSSLTASSVIHLAIPQQDIGSIGRGRSKSAGRLNNHSNVTNLIATQDAVCAPIRNKKEKRKHVRRLTMPASTGSG